MRGARKGWKPRGIALMMSLVVVVLLTAYISEFFFNSGLELRAMRTFQDSSRARNLCRLAFAAVQTALLTDEVQFFTSYAELKRGLALTAIPWEDGFITRLDILPQDHLFNLNELAGLRDSTGKDLVRWNLFRKLWADVPIEPIAEGVTPEPLPEPAVAEIYAALIDWMDKNNFDYQGVAGGLGAEEDAYFDHDPELTVKNGRLDRLSEIRLVRGVVDSHLPWTAWEERFTVLPKSSGGELYPERLNVNLASRAEIVAFLERRRFDNVDLLGPGEKSLQEGVNLYADNAQEIAELLVPADGIRSRYDDKSLPLVLKQIDALSDTKIANQIFRTAGEFYRIRITMEVNDVAADLDSLVRVARKEKGIGVQVDVLDFSLE